MKILILHAHPRPRASHARVSSRLGMTLGGPFDMGSGGGEGGWILLFEPELHLGGDVLVPDLAGWRRTTMPELPEVETVRRGLAPYFTGVRGAPALKKTIIAEILAAHGLKPESVLMIGDAMADLEGAQANNTAFLGRVFPGDPNPFPAHIETVPDLRSLVQ